MKKTILISVMAISLAATTTYLIFRHPSESKVLEAQHTETSGKDDILGYTHHHMPNREIQGTRLCKRA